ncbi:MAG TPA: dodecin family protein [Acidimicrobiia bacterium]|nr:dodecin family protein [Acidimicrobiia bacterium]
MERTYKMAKVVGESDEGIEAAVTAALKTSAEAVRGQEWATIVDLRANLGNDGMVDRWQVTVEIAFEVEE